MKIRYFFILSLVITVSCNSTHDTVSDNHFDSLFETVSFSWDKLSPPHQMSFINEHKVAIATFDDHVYVVDTRLKKTIGEIGSLVNQQAPGGHGVILSLFSDSNCIYLFDNMRFLSSFDANTLVFIKKERLSITARGFPFKIENGKYYCNPIGNTDHRLEIVDIDSAHFYTIGTLNDSLQSLPRNQIFNVVVNELLYSISQYSHEIYICDMSGNEKQVLNAVSDNYTPFDFKMEMSHPHNMDDFWKSGFTHDDVAVLADNSLILNIFTRMENDNGHLTLIDILDNTGELLETLELPDYFYLGSDQKNTIALFNEDTEELVFARLKE